VRRAHEQVSRPAVAQARQGRSAGTLVCEQGRGRKGGWPVGCPAGWGPTSSGEGV
jgi:hypothetical protein